MEIVNGRERDVGVDSQAAHCVCYMDLMISCLRLSSIVSRLGSIFLREARRARSSAADMFKSSPVAAAAVSVDIDSGRDLDSGVVGDDND